MLGKYALPLQQSLQQAPAPASKADQSRTCVSSWSVLHLVSGKLLDVPFRFA